MSSGSIGRLIPDSPVHVSALVVRHLSCLTFPVLYQALFTYLIVIADLVGAEFGLFWFLLFTAMGMAASSWCSFYLLTTRRFCGRYIRLALPMLISLLLPVVQIALLRLVD